MTKLFSATALLDQRKNELKQKKGGKAAELAERGQVVVYPAMGWWRTRTALERYDKEARYAMVISIAVPGVDVDIYSEVSAQIQVEQVVEV